jgi:small ubiquitin-related modifier
MVDSSIVEIGVNCSSEARLMLKVKPATSVHKIVKAYCEAKGLERNSLRFLFDGDRIPEGATVASLGLEEGDWYECMHCRT